LTAAVIKAPGLIDVHLTEQTTGCPSPVGIDTVPLLLTGQDRVYPYAVPVLPPTIRPDTWCTAGH
jgi:hypothetical protein